MTLLVTIIAILIAVAGVVALLRRQVLWGVILLVVAVILGTGGIGIINN